MDVFNFNNDKPQKSSLQVDGDCYIDPASELSLQSSSMTYSDHNSTQLVLHDHDSYQFWNNECADQGHNSLNVPSILDPVYDPRWNSDAQTINPPREISSCLTVANDIPDRSEVTTKRVNSIAKNNEKESSDAEWTGNSNINNNSNSNNTIDEATNQLLMENNFFWTPTECKRLIDAVGKYGIKHNWKEIAAYVGTRDLSQCFNKWKNSLCKKKKRWNKEATKQLQRYVDRGYELNQILELMPEYTYIQIYQQIERRNSNYGCWKQWEIEELIRLKKEGKKSETEIGRCLDNRHRDSVKSMWNRIKDNYQG